MPTGIAALELAWPSNVAAQSGSRLVQFRVGRRVGAR
jgi:hypothetical protein